MANSDKNIRITTSKNKTTYPNIVFTGSAAGSSVITLEVLDDNTLSFTSNEGQVFSIDSNLSTGTIWAVSDISGVPLLSSSAGGTVGLAVYGGIVGIGQTNPIYKLDLKGSFGLASSNDNLYNFIFNNSAASGSNSLQIRSANSLLLYNSGNTFYTGFKSNAATNITYTLPTTDGSSGQFLQTNGSATLTWATATGSGGTGSTTGVGQGGQYEMAYYPGTGLSVIGSNTFTNNTVTGVVSITHSTVATDSSTGAFKVTGGVGIGGSLYVGGIGASITGVTFSNSTITRGTWNGTAISPTYGGTGLNNSSATGLLQYSGGTASVITTSAALASIISDETGTAGKLVFSTSPVFTTSVTTDSGSFSVFNTTATTINAFGAATILSVGASTGKATFNSTDDSSSTTTGSLAVSGGAGIAKSVSIGGRLQMFNGANFTAFVSSASGNTVYTLPATSPATGSSVLQSTAQGVMSWVPMVASSSSGAGSGTVAIPNAQYSVAYYAGTGGSVSGSDTFTNNTSTGVVNISHATVSTTSATGALTVTGGVGIGGSVFTSTLVPSSISGVVFNNGIVRVGSWSATAVTAHYGGTGLQAPFVVGDILYATTTSAWGRLAASSTSGQVLTSNGAGVLPTWQAVPASAASSVAVTPTVVNASFFIPVVNTASSAGLGLSTVSTLVINPSNGLVTVSGLAVTNLTNSSSKFTGALAVSGGLGVTGNAFIGGTINVESTSTSVISGVSFANGVVTVGAWNGTLIAPQYGGTGLNNSGQSGILKYTTGTGSLVAAPSGAIVGTTDSQNLTNKTYNNLTVTAPATNATLTIADTTTFATSGANNLTLTTTATTNVTLPSGTKTLVATDVATLSSLISVGTISTGVWSATAITAHYGGTGLQTPFVVGDILYATSTTAWGRLAASSTSGQVLTSNGAGVLPTWQAVPPAAASSVAVAPTVVNASFFIPVVNSASSSAVGLSTVSTLVINPSNNLVTLSGLAVTAVTQTTSSTTGALVVTNGAAVGQTLSVGGSLNIFNGANYTGFRFTGSASTTYTLPIRTPTGTGTSYLSSSVDGVMAWVAAPTSGGSGSVNSGTATFAAFYASTSNAVSENANLQFTGTGVSVGGNINSSSTLTGSMYVFGGLGISGNAFIGGTVNISSTTPSNIANLLVSSNLSAAGGTFTSLLQAASIRALAGNTISFQTIDGTNAAQINNTRVAVLYSTAATASGSGALQVSGGTGIGGSLYVASASQFESSAASINVGSGALVVTGGVGIGGSINVGGASRFSSSTTAISIGTGALTVTGGAGIAGSLYVGEASRFSSAIVSLGSGTGALTVTGGVGIGGSLYVANTSRFESSVISSSVGTGALTVTGGVGIGGSLYVGDSSRFTSSTIAISSGTGALTVTGGVGIGGSLYVANTSRFESSVISSSVGTGALVVTGGVGIGGSLFVGSASRYTSTNISSSSGTGALTVTGGVGIGGSLYVGDASRFESNINSTSPGVGGLVSTGGVGIGLSVSIGGRLQMFNGSLYTAFASAQSGVNTTYILPPTSPSSAGASFLTSTQAGVMAWVAAPAGGGGGGSPSGSVGDVQYNSGTGNFAATSSFNYANATGMLKTINYNTGSSTNFALLIGENNSVNFTGSATGTLLALSNTSLNGAQYNFIDAKFDNGSPPSNLSVFKVDYVGKTTVADLTITSSSYATRTNNNTLTTSASQAANLTYTLPLAYPSGTGTSFLSASTTGVMAWVAAPSNGSSGAGSGTVAIPNAQYSVAYYAGTGASVSGSATLTNNTATGVVEITHTTESTSTTSGALQVDGGAGIAKSLFVGTTLSVGTTPSYNVPNNLASFVSTVNSYNQLVIQNKSNGTSASANLVVNNDVSTDSTNYGEIGMNSSAFTGSGALSAAGAVYLAAHTVPLVIGTVTSHPIRFVVNNGATDTIYIHEAGTAISVFTNFDLRSQNKIRFYNSGNTFSTSLHAGANTASYALSLPTAPVGNGYSTILVDTSGNMFFAPLEGGLATTSVTGNRVVLRNKMEHHVWMSAGYTPLAAGPDNVIYRVPDSSEDGTSDLTFSIKEFTIRVETPSAGSSRIQLELSSTPTGAFALAATGSSLIGGSGLTISGAGIYLTTLSTFPAGIFVTSGDLLRLNYNLLNATHANFSVAFTLNEV